jgi:hypothetical protein
LSIFLQIKQIRFPSSFSAGIGGSTAAPYSFCMNDRKEIVDLATGGTPESECPAILASEPIEEPKLDPELNLMLL